MAIYSIADLSRLTGIKAHTIRTWEHRFGLLQPGRTDTNIRYYDDVQLKKLLNVNTLLKAGLKISSISQLNDHEMSSELERILSGSDGNAEQFDISIINFVNATLFYNEEEFEKEYQLAVKKFGVVSTFIDVIYPLLNRLGLLWVQDKACPAQEHFISNLIKQKLYVEIDNLKITEENSTQTILFLPEWEEHEIGLLLANLLFRKAGVKVIHLGSKVPMPNIIDAIEYHHPKQIFTILISNHKLNEMQFMFDQLHDLFPELHVFITGNSSFTRHLKLNEQCSWIYDFEEFEKALKLV